MTQKRREVMTSSIHFVEIDLLREGDHLHTRELLPPGEFFVLVSRKDSRPKGYVWPILLTQRLPVIGIPLKEGMGTWNWTFRWFWPLHTIELRMIWKSTTVRNPAHHSVSSTQIGPMLC